MRLVQHIACEGGMMLLQQQRQEAVDRVNVNNISQNVHLKNLHPASHTPTAPLLPVCLLCS